MAELNPYQSPDAEVTTERPLGTGDRVYKPWHVGLATLLGGAFAGLWMMGSNYVALGEPDRRSGMLWIGVGATLVLFTVAYFLPDDISSLPINIATAAATLLACKSIQGESLELYVEDDILWHSAWRAAGVGLLCALIVILIAFAFFSAFYVVSSNYFIE